MNIPPNTLDILEPPQNIDWENLHKQSLANQLANAENYFPEPEILINKYLYRHLIIHFRKLAYLIDKETAQKAGVDVSELEMNNPSLRDRNFELTIKDARKLVSELFSETHPELSIFLEKLLEVTEEDLEDAQLAEV